jgi:hypothetical protein
VARRLADTLGKLGLGVETVTGDLSLLLLRLKKGLFDGVLLEWSGFDGDDIASIFRTRGRDNHGGYSSREVDALLDELRRPPAEGLDGAADAVVKERLRARVSTLLGEDAPALFLYAPDEVYLFAKRLRRPDPWPDFPAVRHLAPR